MRVTRLNFADLAFSLGNEPGEVPVSVVEVPSTLQSVVELCRPLPVILTAPPAAVAQQRSAINSFGQSVAAGAASTIDDLMTLSAGIWRLNFRLRSMTVGAANGSASPLTACSLALRDPSAANYWPFLVHLGRQAANAAQNTVVDAFFHFPVDGFVVSLVVEDPVTALSTIHAAAGLYACKIL